MMKRLYTVKHVFGCFKTICINPLYINIHIYTCNFQNNIHIHGQVYSVMYSMWWRIIFHLYIPHQDGAFVEKFELCSTLRRCNLAITIHFTAKMNEFLHCCRIKFRTCNYASLAGQTRYSKGHIDVFRLFTKILCIFPKYKLYDPLPSKICV